MTTKEKIKETLNVLIYPILSTIFLSILVSMIIWHSIILPILCFVAFILFAILIYTFIESIVITPAKEIWKIWRK